MIPAVDIASPSKFIRSAILLMLEEDASHGYHLLTQLTKLGFDRANPGKVYRSLATLQRGGLVKPTWDTSSGAGPARRVYVLTPEGHATLAAEHAVIRKTAQEIGGPMGRWVIGQLRRRNANASEFRFTITLDVMVMAADDLAAAQTLEAAVRPNRHWKDARVTINSYRTTQIRSK